MVITISGNNMSNENDKACIEYPICDFCTYYEFTVHSGYNYKELGFCNKHNKPYDPMSSCKYFHCRLCNEINSE